ncbi:MAG: efflux RND transporter permease subunit [Spirochaetaceae bacterium]|nr:MAG: efflux RND transporter permease subunit [Spirochaetaceae bacterium]
MTIGDFSTRNSVLINIFTILLLVLGTISVIRLPQEQFSEVPFFFINITVPWPGVSAEDIEESVTTVIENEMEGVDRLSQFSSVTRDGVTTVVLQFDQEINRQAFDRVFQDVRNRFATLNLPDGVGQERITEFSSNDFLPVIEVVLFGDVGYEALNRTAERLSDRLTTIREVSGVDIVGARERTFFVEADPVRLESFGVTVEQLVGAVQARNTTTPGGSLRTPTRQFLLRTVGDLSNAAELESVVVRSAANGAGPAGGAPGGLSGPGLVRVQDVATVFEGYDEDGVRARFNGQESITLRITKVPGGSSVSIAEEAERRIANLRGSVIPEGMEVAFVNDSTVQIRDSIDVLVSNAVLGLVLLVAILLVFVGVRNALMTALGIPVTFAITFIILESLGETLNSNTLFGLVLVLGLIVDHAIVIVENSYRLQSQGLSRRDAAIKGVNQVLVPVWAATATTVAAFLPLAFLPGIIGRFLRVVPITVAIALIASTFEASVFLPSHFADWPGRSREGRIGARFERFKDTFRGFLTAVYRRRVLTVFAMLLVMVGSFSLVGFIGQDLFAAEDASQFFIDIEMPPGTPIQRTDEVVRRFEERLMPLVGQGEYRAVNAYVGFAAGEAQNRSDPRVGQLVIDLLEADEGRPRSVLAILTEAEQMAADIPGAEFVRFRRQQTGPPVDAPLVYRLFGDSYEELILATEAIRAELIATDGVFDIRDNFEVSTPELRITVDDNEAARFGLNRQSVGLYIRAGFEGLPAGRVFTDNRETPVRVRYAFDGAMTAERLLDLSVPTNDGRRIPLSTIARVEDADAIASIQRLNGRREVTIEAEVQEGVDLGAIDARIVALFAEELSTIAPGVELETEGQFAEFQNLLIDILRTFLIGVFLIYMILATQFKSYTQPALILFSVPFAFVGVVLFLFLSGTPLSSIVIYAAVALAGIAVNDSIVLISFINELRDEGWAVRDAIIEAAATRLRPILLTSLTTIAGLLPTALGLGGQSVVWGPMASTIVFGLVFSTITALVIIPCLYGILFDRQKRRPA